MQTEAGGSPTAGCRMCLRCSSHQVQATAAMLHRRCTLTCTCSSQCRGQQTRRPQLRAAAVTGCRGASPRTAADRPGPPAQNQQLGRLVSTQLEQAPPRVTVGVRSISSPAVGQLGPSVQCSVARLPQNEVRDLPSPAAAVACAAGCACMRPAQRGSHITQPEKCSTHKSKKAAGAALYELLVRQSVPSLPQRAESEAALRVAAAAAAATCLAGCSMAPNTRSEATIARGVAGARRAGQGGTRSGSPRGLARSQAFAGANPASKRFGLDRRRPAPAPRAPLEHRGTPCLVCGRL